MSASQKAWRVLFVGQEPASVDFADPALPPGLDAAKIEAGIAVGMRQMTERGWRPELCFVHPDRAPVEVLAKQLDAGPYDCVVIGGGLRLPPKGLVLFEALVNTVHRHAPGVALAFNTRPEDTADAAGRWLGR